jgi:DNA gyrase subunit A
MAVTKKGTIKKTPLSQFDNIRKNGLIAITLNDGDELIGIKQTSGTNIVTIVTRMGKSISFMESDIRPMGRAAMGVRAITLGEGDEVVAMDLGEKGEQLLVVTENGYGKRTPVEEYTIQKRGGQGLLTYDKKKFNKTGKLIGACIVTDEDDLMLINSAGVIIRVDAASISSQSRTTLGVKIMRVDEDTHLVAMAKVVKEDETEAADAE